MDTPTIPSSMSALFFSLSPAMVSPSDELDGGALERDDSVVERRVQVGNIGNSRISRGELIALAIVVTRGVLLSVAISRTYLWIGQLTRGSSRGQPPRWAEPQRSYEKSPKARSLHKLLANQ